MTPPAWLLEAREHLRAHYPADGLAESLLWALALRDFELPAEDTEERVDAIDAA